MEISSHGPHQLALRRRSVKVFEGAMKVSTMRAPSESEAESVGDAGGTGRTGAAAIGSSWEDSTGILIWVGLLHKPCNTSHVYKPCATRAGRIDTEQSGGVTHPRPLALG